MSNWLWLSHPTEAYTGMNGWGLLIRNTLRMELILLGTICIWNMASRIMTSGPENWKPLLFLEACLLAPSLQPLQVSRFACQSQSCELCTDFWKLVSAETTWKQPTHFLILFFRKSLKWRIYEKRVLRYHVMKDGNLESFDRRDMALNAATDIPLISINQILGSQALNIFVSRTSAFIKVVKPLYWYFFLGLPQLVKILEIFYIQNAPSSLPFYSQMPDFS